jgi:hypothetical protein
MHIHTPINPAPLAHSISSRPAGRALSHRALLADDAALLAALDHIPWARLLSLRCDRRPDGKRALQYTCRPPE